jgi:Cys-rich repeat protein
MIPWDSLRFCVYSAPSRAGTWQFGSQGDSLKGESMQFRLVIGCIFVAMMWVGVGCSTDGGVTSCVGDLDCAYPMVCVNGGCAVQACENNGFCATTQVCINAGDSQFCVPAQCGCLDCEPCAEGFECLNGQCAQVGCDGPDCPCENNTQCDTGFVCDAGQCRVCQGAECGASDCTVTGCPEGQLCDPTTKTCLAGATADVCGSCASPTDCPASWKCVPLGSGQHCLPPCAGSDDCATGWTCFSGACNPSGFSCTGCNATGCPDGQVCDTTAGVCGNSKQACESCTYDWECGAGQACHGVNPGVRVCVPRCVGGSACTGASTCVDDADSGYKVCTPTGNTCCFDPDPSKCPEETCNPPCGGTTPHCSNSGCVECTDNSHCAPGVCNTTTGQCEGANQCNGATPHWSDAKQQCVQCLEDGHCGGSPCDLQTNTCTNDLCGSCVDPYPACTEVNGEWYCVQCTDDSHCGAGGTCNLDTFSCEGGTVVPTDPCGGDAECDAGVSGYSLYCGGDGLCHDEDGGCDDVTAFCLNANECLSLLDLLGGGGLPGGGLPGGLPGGQGMTLPGYCECTPDGGGIIPGLPGPSKDCPDGVLCGNFLEILGGGGGGKNVCGAGLGGLGF